MTNTGAAYAYVSDKASNTRKIYPLEADDAGLGQPFTIGPSLRRYYGLTAPIDSEWVYISAIQVVFGRVETSVLRMMSRNGIVMWETRIQLPNGSSATPQNFWPLAGGRLLVSGFYGASIWAYCLDSSGNMVMQPREIWREPNGHGLFGCSVFPRPDGGWVISAVYMQGPFFTAIPTGLIPTCR